MPPVVYRYDPDQRTYSPDTPRYAAAFMAQLNRDVDYAREELAKPEDIRNENDVCIVHGPVIITIYLTGKFGSGFELLRSLLPERREEFEQDIMKTISASPHFAAR